MPRYEHAQLQRFWEIEQEAASVTIREGALASPGEWSTKTYKTEHKAERAVSRAVRTREKRGFELVEGPSGIARCHDLELERAMLERPDDPEPYLVYADYLQEFGDPRGELITVQFQRDAEPDRKRFAGAERRLLVDQRDYFLGQVFPYLDRLELDWRWGFIHRASYGSERFFDDVGSDTARYVLQKLHTHPSARLLRALDIRAVGWLEGDAEWSFDVWGERPLNLIGFDEVAEAFQVPMPALQQLSIGRPRAVHSSRFRAEFPPVSHALPALFPLLPNLRTLQLYGRHFVLEDLDLPELRDLTLGCVALEGDAIDSLVSHVRESLESLEIWLGRAAPQRIPANELDPILDGRAFPNLKHLAIRNTPNTDAICARMARAPVVSQLETLDLSMGTLTDDGVQHLLDARDRFAHLERLVLDDNALRWGIGAAQALCREVHTFSQRTDDEGHWGVENLHDLIDARDA